MLGKSIHWERSGRAWEAKELKTVLAFVADAAGQGEEHRIMHVSRVMSKKVTPSPFLDARQAP
jgi:hypothetical protein